MERPAAETTDGALVTRSRDGERDAYGELVSRYAVAVQGLCAGMVGLDAASELAHEALVEAWLKLSKLRDPDRFAPWLRTLTLNLCRQWHRDRQRRQGVIAGVDLDELPAAGAVDRSALDSLCAGLARLSSAHRLSLALHYDAGLSYEQIAAFLDVPTGTVMSRLHRGRSKLRERMAKMSPSDSEAGEAGGQDFREAVDAEIEVLLRLWDEQSPDNRGRFFSAAGKRLSLLVQSSPDMMRPVLASMSDALTEHAALLLRRGGGEAIAVAVACAFGDDPASRSSARRVLTQVLRHDSDQALNESYFLLPLRLTATWILDAVIRGPQGEAAKAQLLVELLPGCEEDATLVLMALVLCAYEEHAFPLLLASWKDAGDDAAAGIRLAALGRFRTTFLKALDEMLTSTDAAILCRTVTALQATAQLIGGGCLSRETPPDPPLERRVSGRHTRDELDAAVLERLCGRLEGLIEHADATVRDGAIAALSQLGTGGRAAAVRPCLQSPHASTRHAAVVGVSALGDRASVPTLMRLARNDEPQVRRMALQALGHLGAREALPQLVELLDDGAVRPNAISALGEIGDDEAKAKLQELTKGADKKVARMAASALYGGTHTPRPSSELRRARLAKIRGVDARPLMHISVVAAIRHLPEIRPYPEVELTRLIGEVCGDYSTTRRELVMGSPGLMVRSNGIYELSGTGLAVWRVERFLKEHERVG